jgi:hypothetical protein
MKSARNIFEAHRPFFAEIILPILTDYASRSNSDEGEVLMSSFLALGILVQLHGYSVNQLLEMISDAYVAPHAAPETLQ